MPLLVGRHVHARRGVQQVLAGKDSDRAHWLSMWSGGGINILRKGSDPILVERTAVSLFGAIQQDKLTDLLYGDDAAAKSGDGFWSRFLWVSPPYVFPHVNRNEVEINTQLMELVERLDACSKKPIVVTFSDDAWVQQLESMTVDGAVASMPTINVEEVLL